MAAHPPRLVLVRHAQSGWAVGGTDRQRTLDAKGRAQTGRMKRHLESLALVSPAVLCSPARRTQETWDRIGANADDAELVEVDRLYLGTAEAYLGAVEDHGGPGDVVLIGHNPICSQLLSHWSGQPNAPYPAGGMAVIARDTGEFLSFHAPADMEP